jgi:hypothetical protein
MILIGWKSICSVADNACEDTLRRWTKENGFPVIMIGKTPVSSERAIEMWVERMMKGTLSTKKSP